MWDVNNPFRDVGGKRSSGNNPSPTSRTHHSNMGHLYMLHRQETVYVGNHILGFTMDSDTILVMDLTHTQKLAHEWRISHTHKNVAEWKDFTTQKILTRQLCFLFFQYQFFLFVYLYRTFNTTLSGSLMKIDTQHNTLFIDKQERLQDSLRPDSVYTLM